MSKKVPHPTAAAWRILAVVIVIQVFVFSLVMPFVPDDSYISFRYAENLANGNGLTYNSDDAPLEGYSNFLWIVVLSTIHWVGLSLPTAAPLLGAFLGLLCTFLLWRLYQNDGLTGVALLIPLLVLCSAGPLVIYSVSGLETPLFALLLLGLLWTARRTADDGRTMDAVVFGTAGVLVSLCRPEGVIAFPVVAATVVFFRRDLFKTVAIAAGIFAVLYAVYTIWRVTYFGDFWPTPFLSKSAGGVGGFVEGWTKNLRQFFVMQGQGFPPTGFYFFGILLAAWIGWRRVKERIGIQSLAFILASVYVLVYFNFVDWMPGMRYHAPLIPLLLLPGALAVSGLAEKREGGESRTVTITLSAIIVLLSFAVLMPLRLSAHRLERGNQECLIALADWLKNHVPPNPTLAVSDVGVIPYYTRFHTIDINPESLTDRHIAHNGFSSEYFYSTQPDVLVLVSQGVYVPVFYPEHFALAETNKFNATYRLIGVARYDWYRDRSYWVYLPKNTPPLSDEAFDSFPAGVGRLRQVQR